VTDPNAQTPETDEGILRVARELFKKAPTLRRCHSGTNYCVVLSFADRTADRVFKLANRNDWAIEFERLLYPPMRMRGLPVPEIEFTQLDYAGDSLPFIVMPKFSDHTLLALRDVDEGAAEEAFEKSGRFIHEIHDRFADAFPPFLELEELNGTLALQQQAYERDLDLSVTWDRDPSLARRIEDRLKSFHRPTTRRLIHGGLGARNIMANRDGEICVIDLGESVGMSSPLKDLGALLMDANSSAQVKAILRGYGQIDDRDVEELRYWELFGTVWDMQGHMVVFPDGEFTKILTERVGALVEGESLLPELPNE